METTFHSSYQTQMISFHRKIEEHADHENLRTPSPTVDFQV